MSLQVIVNKKKITLNSNNYLAQGGQGIIYLKNNVIYKIYHDVNKLIPEKKIEELNILKDIKNVIVPSLSIIDNKTNKRIGFIMRYVDNTEYLCKLFTNTYKNKNSISQQTIVDLVKKMQETLIEIHKQNVVVGDYNEMNFLTDSKYKIPYHIDTDSYQTESFKCNAIMESVRDRSLAFGDFNELSDWFSWAIVSFQLYTGIHPYKGKHPQYKQNELNKRMDDNVSVFSKDISVPKFVDFNIIPKKHLDWYKNIFINKDRSAPPFSDGIGKVPVIKKIYIDNKSNVIAELLYKFNNDILDVVYKNGIYYIITNDGVYFDNKLKIKFNSNTNNGKLLFTPTNDLLIVIHSNDKLMIFDNNKNIISELDVKYSDYNVFNNCVYVISEFGVIQYSFEMIGKIKCIPNVMSTLNYNSSSIYDGVVLQDVFGKYSAIIPYEYNQCKTIKIPEIEGSRILDCKRLGKWLFIIYDDKGKINHISLLIKDNMDYDYKIEENIGFRNINAIIKDNNMIVYNKEDNDLELFFDFDKGSKVLDNTPVYNEFEMINGKDVCFVNKNELYFIKMK